MTLALFTAGVATLYILEVAITSVLTISGYNIPRLVQLSKQKPFIKFIMGYEILTSIHVELSLQAAVIKLFLIQLVKLFGGFNYALCRFMYWIDIATLLGLGGHFFDMLNEKNLAESTIKLINKKNLRPLESFMSAESFKKYIQPTWRPSDIIMHPHITYATNEEIKQALDTSNQDFDQPRKLMLDVITTRSPKKTGLRPVLFHIHGGGWKLGHKNIFYAYQKLMIPEDEWVIVNVGYRLAPKNPYPAHLIDIKRALRWTKQNIASFGGDPNFIVAIGDSAGGHLSAVAALTANDPRYQPGFEQVDTSLRAVISINGVLDLLHDENTTAYFSRLIANHPEIDHEFISQHSPACLVKKSEKLVPFLCLAGERDNLVTVKEAINFKTNYEQRNQSSCTLAIAPAGHHLSYIFWSPRSLYSARIIQAWCRQLYENKD